MTRGKHRARLRNGAVFFSLLTASGLGCGASDAADTASGGGGAAVGGGPEAGDGSGASGAEPGGAAGTRSEPAGGGGPGSGAGGASGAGGVPADTSPRSRLELYHEGDAARALSFELDAVGGLEPYASSLEYLTGFVSRALDKPDGVFFEADETLPPFGAEHVWGFAELDTYARAHARDDGSGPVSIHVLLLDGQYDGGEESGTVLGLAWGQRYIALFQQSIRAGCSGGLLGGLSEGTCEIAERNVWAHEIGHVIGLVDNGLTQQTPHRDPDHGRHDVSDACLMHWSYERPAIFDVIVPRLSAGQSPDLELCDNCWADLNARRR